MPYFPVDDQFAFHPKALASGNAALGIWVRAGAWTKAHAQGGFVPTDVALAIGPKRDAMRLVAAGLWIVVTGGFRFHDWEDQAGNFDAEEEKARREAIREKDRLRKRAQRDRERDGHTESHADIPGGHAGNPPGIRSTPSPSPLTTDINARPVPQTGPVTDGPDESIEALCVRQARTIGVDFVKVKTEIGKACGRFPDPTAVMRIISAVLARATPPVKSPTGIVLAAVRNDWAEWQQFLDEEAAS